MKQVGSILRSLVPVLALSVFLLVAGGLQATSHAKEQQEIAGRYRFNGTQIRHKITIPQQRPAAVIVIQYLPPHTKITQALPNYNSYDETTGIAKWLFGNAEPGLLHINITLAQPVNSHLIRAEVLFKDQTGISNAYTIAPAPLKRKALEGC